MIKINHYRKSNWRKEILLVKLYPIMIMCIKYTLRHKMCMVKRCAIRESVSNSGRWKSMQPRHAHYTNATAAAALREAASLFSVLYDATVLPALSCSY